VPEDERPEAGVYSTERGDLQTFKIEDLGYQYCGVKTSGQGGIHSPAEGSCGKALKLQKCHPEWFILGPSDRIKSCGVDIVTKVGTLDKACRNFSIFRQGVQMQHRTAHLKASPVMISKILTRKGYPSVSFRPIIAFEIDVT
jgi:hypothetical protein